ncbi:MAG: hypothetical protein MJ193_05400, partial [Clostridia bacterium]|nr:hypothetical protein [Clostridia bacterium]
ANAGVATDESIGICVKNDISIMSGRTTVTASDAAIESAAIKSENGTFTFGTLTNPAIFVNQSENYEERVTNVFSQYVKTEPLVIYFERSIDVGGIIPQTYAYDSKKVGTSITFNNFDVEPQTVTVELYKDGELYKTLEGSSRIGKLIFDIYRIDVGEYDLKVIATDDGEEVYSTEMLSIIKALDNEIKGLAIKGWKEGNQPNAPTATAKYGEIVYKYASSPNGEFTETVPDKAGVWYVRAEVYETQNFNGAVSDTVKFNVTRKQLVSADGMIIVETENGFDPDIELYGRYISKDSIFSTSGLLIDYKSLKIADDEHPGLIYIIKLTKLDAYGNPIEVQPEDLGEGTLITIKVLIPEEIKD